jgi:hypothetical protein
MHNRREGMLRPEFQDWYPTLTAGRWYPADELTELVVDHLQHGSPQWRAQGRVPSDHHFAFRGGSPREGPPGYSRAADRSPHRSGESHVRPHLDP